MDRFDFGRLTATLYRKMQKNRAILLSLAVVVVFVTTYILVLPALTLDEDEAREQGGITLSEEAQAPAEDPGTKPTEEASQASAEPAEEPAPEKTETETAAPEKVAKDTGSASAEAPEKSKDEVKAEAAEEPQPATDLSFEGEGYQVSASCDAAAALPADTELTVQPIDKKDDAKEYKNYYKMALSAVREDAEKNQPKGSDAKGEDLIEDLLFAHFYDITMAAGSAEVEPEAPVSVSFAFDKALKVADPDRLRIIHFAVDPETGETTPELLESKDIDLNLKKDKMTQAAFQAERFSVYGIVYTMDFHWDVDGEKFEYSIPGGGAIAFSELAKALGIAEDPDVFVANIENVEFSDPILLWIGKASVETTVGALKKDNDLKPQSTAELTQAQIDAIDAKTIAAGDWALISLKPFDSEETLTVTMRDGEKFEVKVTDYQISTNVLTIDGKSFIISVTYDDTAEIPEGTKLDAKEIEYDTDAYHKYLGRTWTEINRSNSETKTQRDNNTEKQYININAARFFDIKLVNEGEVIEPKAPVQVEIAYADGLLSWDDTKPGVVHFTQENKAEIIKRVETEIENDTAVSFRYVQDSFSVIGTYIQQETQNAETPPRGAQSISSSSKAPARNAVHVEIPEGEQNNDNTTSTIAPFALRATKATEQPDTADNSQLPKPRGNKSLEPNKDGTYTLTLSVKGSSQTTIQKVQKKANVLFVMDRSSSMITNTVDDTERYWYYGTRETATFRRDVGDPSYGEGGNYQFYYKDSNGDYKPLNARWTNWSDVTFTYADSGQPYPRNADLYVKSKTTRLYAEQEALDDVIGRLLAYNSTEIPDEIEVAVISFADHRTDTKGWTDTEYTDWVTGTDKSSIMNAVNSTRFASGTNWEEALKYAYDVISEKKADEAEKPEEDYYVVFLTDGEPTNIVGDTSAAQHTGDAGNKVAYDAAKDDALALVRDGYKFYNIFTYRKNEPVKYSKYLTNYAYSNGQSDYNANNTDAVNAYFSDAQTIESLNDTFNNIFQTIADVIGHADVSITDTLTTDAMTTTVVQGKTNGYVYTVKNPAGDVLYSVTATGDINSPTVTFNVPNSETKAYTTNEYTDVDGKKLFSIITAEGDEYRMTLADVNDQTGKLEWDLSPVGILMNDCEYSVSFVVWPDQEAYDYVAALNNGLEGYTWSTATSTYEDLRDTKGYEKGGVEKYPSIVKKSDGTFAVLTNEDQKIHYSVVELETVNGELNGDPEVHGPYYHDLQLPDPMPLTASSSQIEKVWNVDRDPDILAKLLYGSNGDPGSSNKQYTIGFNILQDNNNSPYTSVSLGWDEENGQYIWEDTKPTDVIYVKWDSAQNKYVNCPEEDENALPIGTRWKKDFSIATGLMLSEERMTALGLDKNAYTWTTYPAQGGTKYYLLEEGHDYTIEEPNVGYEFDFEAPVYHPMLVDGVLKNVDLEEIVKNDDGKITSFKMKGISEIDVAEGGRSALTVANTLRGYLHLNKVVVDQSGNQIPSDNTKFSYTITLTNEDAPFEGDHIPWYGINGLFYHDQDFNYYQATPGDTGQLTLKTESGETYEATCSGAFNPDIIGPTSVTYTVAGERKSIQLYGNQTQASSDKKMATATMKISQSKVLNIANIPSGTDYSITETSTDGYALVRVEREIKDGNNQEKYEDLSDHIGTGNITGTIVANRDNHVIYSNRRDGADLEIYKVDKNSLDDETKTYLEGAQFTITQLEEEGVGNYKLDPESSTEPKALYFQTTLTTDENGKAIITSLKPGYYEIKETVAPAGYNLTLQPEYIKVNLGVITRITKTQDNPNTSDLNEGLVENWPENTDNSGMSRFESAKQQISDDPSTSEDESQEAVNAYFIIGNEPGVPLPFTGGPGTRIFYVLGFILLVGSATLLVARRRID